MNLPFLDVTLQDWYYLSKTMAEREAFAYAAKTGLDAVTICPSLVIGPLMQSTVNSSSKILLNYFKGRVIMCWFSLVFVYAW
jgi:nucleoside-diphosphate-sugar epimerase